jgi:hypothetical protein
MASISILCTPYLSFLSDGLSDLILLWLVEWLYQAMCPEGDPSASIVMLDRRNP